jgi:hypothetical protein
VEDEGEGNTSWRTGREKGGKNDYMTNRNKYKQQTLWPESASRVYWPSDRRLLTKLVPTFADRGVSRSQRNGSSRLYFRFSRPEPLLFLPSSSSIALTGLSGPHSRPTASQKIW